MNRKGIGVGSASLVLVFTVLCLVIFTIISHTSARNEMALAESEAQLVKGYYEADALAGQILTEIIAADIVPHALHGVDINTRWDSSIGAQIVEFSCIITQQKELYVKIALYDNDYNILIWQLRNTGRWEHDTDMPVWFAEREDS